MIQITAPDGSVTTTDYDDTAATTTDPLSKARKTFTDARGRLNKVIEDPDGTPVTTEYAYDTLDNLMLVCQDGTISGGSCSGGRARTFEYDSLSRLTEADNPESGTITYAYDTANSSNRPSNCSGDGGPKGQLASVSNSVTANYYYYNKLGQTVCSRQATASTNFDFKYTATPPGEWAQIVYPSGSAGAGGKTVNTSFDDAGRPVSVSGGASVTYASNLLFAPHGGLTQLKFGNGVTETSTYNGRLQPTNIAAAKGASSLLSLGYGYTKTSGCNGGLSACNNGNVMSQTITPPGSWSASQSYGYDGVNRLTSASEAGDYGWSENFGYDARGNQWVDTFSGFPSLSPLTPRSSSWFGTNNRVEDPGDANKFDYDTRGNQSVIGGTGILLAYDGENHQSSYTVTNATKELYSYDGEGRRVKHEHQVYSGGSFNTTATTLYVYDAQGRLAAEYGAQSANSPCVTCYLTTDALGSTRLMMDQAGTGVARYDYLPFGQEILPPQSGERASVMCGTISCYGQSSAVNQKFTGKERDSDTGLDFFLARYMSTAEGRFTSPDEYTGGPLDIFGGDSTSPGALPYADITNPQSLNKYYYTYNNPLRYTDPDGHCPWCAGAAIGALAGGGASVLVQLYSNPTQYPDWDKVAAATLGGAIVGGSGGLAYESGLPLILQGVAVGSVGMANGIAQRAVNNGGDLNAAMADPLQMGIDFGVAGFTQVADSVAQSAIAARTTEGRALAELQAQRTSVTSATRIRKLDARIGAKTILVGEQKNRASAVVNAASETISAGRRPKPELPPPPRRKKDDVK